MFRQSCAFRFINLLLLIAGSLCNKPKEYYFTEHYSSSTLGLLKLLDLENKFIAEVKAYGDILEDKLQKLESFLKTHKSILPSNFTQRESHVSNPILAFALVRRLREDWIVLQEFLPAIAGGDQLETLTTIVRQKPTLDDMMEALIGMDRIELTYGLKSMDIANGRLQDKQFRHGLSQRDCLKIGNYNYMMRNFSKAALWYRIVLKTKLEPNSQTYIEVLGKCTEGLRIKFARALQQHGSPLRNSIELQKEVDEVFANTSSIDLEEYVRAQLAGDEQKFISEQDALLPAATSHDLGCRGQFPKQTDLSCSYNFLNTPFLRLAPFKMEELNRDPHIVMYHNVLSDLEVEEMKDLSVDMENGLSGPIRENQTESLDIVARATRLTVPSPLRERINHRMTDMTGMDLSEFPELLISNYGLGTYFQPHHDSIYGGRLTEKDLNEHGDRMASIVIYAGDVEYGGFTVFPDIQVSVAPKKGSSLVWYNLFDDGTPDKRALHSVCPVVVGSRWTITKWLHVVPQMFIRRCSLGPSQAFRVF
ncbi:hypothetical protein KR222_009647 [Zaprionus bogoriensis]|nr:hypothetical protein KR222_009647 [Zaprionus bogoriensis]